MRRRPDRLFLLTGGAQGLAWSAGLPAVVWWVVKLRLSPLQLALLGTALVLTILLAEAPTGVLADLYGRKPSVVASFAVMGAAMALMAASPAFAVMMIAQAVLAAGWTLQSGAATAWVTDEHQSRSSLPTGHDSATHPRGPSCRPERSPTSPDRPAVRDQPDLRAGAGRWTILDVAGESTYPLAEATANREATSGVRATVISFLGQAEALGQVLGGVSLGLVAHFVSLPVALGAAAELLAMAAIPVTVVARRWPNPRPRPAPRTGFRRSRP